MSEYCEPLKLYLSVVGCKVNQVEGAMLLARFKEAGWQETGDEKQADLILIHTCTVTYRADRDCRKRIEKAHQNNNKAFIVISGCLAELESQHLEGMDGVLAVIPQKQRQHIVEIVNEQLEKKGKLSLQETTNVLGNDPGFFEVSALESYSGRARVFIKIEDGCDGLCSYCRVRLARGKPVSRSLNAIVEEAKQFIRKGYQELIITGVNIGCWESGLHHVVDVLAALDGKFRLRLSSVEPQHLNQKLIESLVRHKDKLCPHIHLPIQSGDDQVLAAMKRSYDSKTLLARVVALKNSWPEIVLTGDVIVGFPGETKKAFERTCRVVQELGMVRLHVFPFSARQGTEAAHYPDQIIQHEITSRAKQLRELADQLKTSYKKTLVGKQVSVLLEQEKSTDNWIGTTEHYDKAHIHCKANAGQIRTGKVISLEGDMLILSEEA